MPLNTQVGIRVILSDVHFPIAESTQTVQALQHTNSTVPPGANKEVEIRSLKSEIDILKKQIAGNRSDQTSRSHSWSDSTVMMCDFSKQCDYTGVSQIQVMWSSSKLRRPAWHGRI